MANTIAEPAQDERPITLREAGELYRLKVSTLRAEASRGRLDIFRLGKRDYTTLSAMREMVRKCQDAARLRASTSTPDVGNGLSETERLSSAQAALRTTVTALKQRLAAYLGQKHRPQRSPAPLIADVLMAYASEHLPHTRSARNAAYNVANLSAWWGDKKLSDVTARNCRAYADTHTPALARRDLELLRAAIGHKKHTSHEG